jgi:hypothetical protein
MPSNHRTHRLSHRDRAILDDVARYRLITSEVLHKRHFPRQKRNAVAKVTGRLRRKRLLFKFPLFHPRSYYTLAPHSALLLGVPVHRSLPLGTQSLPSEYAVLAYATLGATEHARLTASELAELCPWMQATSQDAPYCLDTSQEPPVLELIRVDLGGKADHVARKCDADIQVRRPLGEFETWVRNRRFRLVVVSGTSEKAALIRQSLEEHLWPDGLSIHLVVVPELLQLRASVHHGT